MISADRLLDLIENAADINRLLSSVGFDIGRKRQARD
jgi:hypothetical protein